MRPLYRYLRSSWVEVALCRRIVGVQQFAGTVWCSCAMAGQFIHAWMDTVQLCMSVCVCT